MRRIALTGGIACGKSLVAKILEELGVEIIDADAIVHELIPDPAERRRIAAEVFKDAAKRKALEARLHPIVKERIREFFVADSATRVAAVPLLYECGWEDEFDCVICVSSRRETQIERMMTTRGYSRDEAEARLAAQLPVEEKAARADLVVENNGTPDELRHTVIQSLRHLTTKSLRHLVTPSVPKEVDL